MSDFPQRPRGDPGGVEGAANALADASLALSTAAVGLAGAGSSMSWQGYAQRFYQSASLDLTQVATAAASTCDACARVVARYAEDLEAAQTQLERLRVEYEEQRERAAAARQSAQGLAGMQAVWSIR